MDISAFYEADPRRRASDEVRFGLNWRARGEKGGWSVFWIRDTGELAAMQNGVAAPTFGEGLILADLMGAAIPGVAVLLIEADEDALKQRLDGWEMHHDYPDGLVWLRQVVGAT